MKRRVFYSFHYERDNWRASQVRNIGVVEGNRPATDNEWEAVRKQGDLGIKKWIAGQMANRTCTVVLVGAATAGRKWIDHEIIESWNKGMGVVGIRIHGLKNEAGLLSRAGNNPFTDIRLGRGGPFLSEIVKCYNPVGSNSQQRYRWISVNLTKAIEEAIDIRKQW